MDGQLAVIGLGSIGSMALWQASRSSNSVVGFEAYSPGHARSAAGGDTRLFRMLYRGTPSYYPILERSRRLWAELEAESGQYVLTRCGGLSIGTVDGPYLPHLLETTRINGSNTAWSSGRRLCCGYRSAVASQLSISWSAPLIRVVSSRCGR
jgi:sarcosine oxidase